MANDFIRIDLDTSPSEQSRTLFNALKDLRQGREELVRVREWMNHSISLSDYTVLETRFGLPAGTGSDAFLLVDGSLQALDGTSSGYVNDMLGRFGNSAS